MTESDFLGVICSLLVIFVVLSILIIVIKDPNQTRNAKSSYIQGFARCRICRYQCISVLEGNEEIDMECPNCSYISLEFVTEEEWNRTLSDAILKSYD